MLPLSDTTKGETGEGDEEKNKGRRSTMLQAPRRIMEHEKAMAGRRSPELTKRLAAIKFVDAPPGGVRKPRRKRNDAGIMHQPCCVNVQDLKTAWEQRGCDCQ